MSDDWNDRYLKAMDEQLAEYRARLVELGERDDDAGYRGVAWEMIGFMQSSIEQLDDRAQARVRVTRRPGSDLPPWKNPDS
jgi:hypothetical protein